MRLTDILTEDRVRVVRHLDGIRTMPETIEVLASMLATGAGLSSDDVCKVLIDRESLQSTGIGDGVAVPHGSMDSLDTQTAAVLLCQDGIDFHSIDDRLVQIVVGVLGPRRATGEHLRMLARISRLLRDSALRCSLLESVDGAAAYAVIRAREDGGF